jgi:hypothetical protein
MQARQIYKSGAVVLIVAIAMISVSEVLRLLVLNGGGPSAAGNALFVPTFVLSMVGTTLVIISMPVTYARQAARAGKTGLIGLACYIAAGLIFGYAIAALNAIIVPFLYGDPKGRVILETGHPAGFVPLVLIGTLLFTVGNLCYGIGTLRAAVYPRAFAFSLIGAAIFEVGGIIPQAANISFPGWTDLITDAASFGPIAAMAVWLLSETRRTQDEVPSAAPRTAIVASAPARA